MLLVSVGSSRFGDIGAFWDRITSFTQSHSSNLRHWETNTENYITFGLLIHVYRCYFIYNIFLVEFRLQPPQFNPQNPLPETKLYENNACYWERGRG